MSHRLGKALALSTVSAALAVGGLTATASADRGHPEDTPHHGHHCKGLQGKKKRGCEAHHHHHGQGGNEGSSLY